MKLRVKESVRFTYLRRTRGRQLGKKIVVGGCLRGARGQREEPSNSTESASWIEAERAAARRRAECLSHSQVTKEAILGILRKIC
ncbi:hypothetical protein AXF42_Ash007375 [Apostasia shenzhenica]|uniref:Uncharacterized protein n=1 Tax=Apostasia shenzhenica TaxID=1088818 RepID=A0A2I0B9Z5_9ASPA|nr:hypothetical protein AXF42_Ash007375 [Apostasia shenzhenica]